MYLKSLTLKGFKSFASATTMQMEPGITCIVGPNGSGKSNVVDALAWVMGEQGAKSLRGGKMEDVIFAGTASRPPLGRAEVQLTIDNSDGALPIEYTEVTISRTMFRNGGSEYAINGQTCRLLDVQDLLSDSGIGREMHVIVGQGQLDSILRATPEERRGFIEEAAGVLKHRKRKEKALRKLDSTEGNLTRLNDLLTEIRRQLKPLGRQAEVARRAQTVQAEVRDARARLLADDLARARESLAQEMADESVLIARRAEVESQLNQLREQESSLELALREDLPALSRAQETYHGLTGLRERIRGTASLAAERVRNAQSQPEIPQGRDPDELEAEAERASVQEAENAAQVESRQAQLNEAIQARQLAEKAFHDAEQELAVRQRAAADSREGIAKLIGKVNALKSRAAAADDELGRLASARAAAIARAERAQKDFTVLESTIAGLDAGEEGLDAEHEAASSLLADIEERLTKLRESATSGERERAALAARKEALEVGLNRKDGAGALLAASDSVSGLLGSVAALISVRPGYEAAVATALGDAANAIAVTDSGSAIAAIGKLKDDDLGRAGLLLGDARESVTSQPNPPEGAIRAIDVVECPTQLRPALSRLLSGMVVVADLATARRVVAQDRDLTVVTRDGDLLGAHYASGGSSSTPSLIEVQAAVDEATEKLRVATAALERQGFEIATLENERQAAAGRVDVALAKLHESDATLAAVAEELGQFGSQARSARAEASRLEEAIRSATTARETDLAGLAELEERLTAAQEAPEEEPDPSQRDRLGEESRAARAAEMDARLALRTAEERARAISGRAEKLRRTAQAERDARAAAIARRAQLIREGQVGEAVGRAAEIVLARLEESIELAAAARTQVESNRARREQDLLECRQFLREVGATLDDLVNTVHRDEMARTEQKMRIEQYAERALEEL